MDLSDDHYKQVGRICISHSSLEENISIFTSLLIDSKHTNTSQIITGGLNFSSKVNLLSSLGKGRIEDKKEYETLIEIIKKINKLNEQRNNIIHSAWWTEHGTNKVTLGKVNKKDKTKYLHTEIKVEELKSVANNIQQVSKRLMEYMIVWAQNKT